MKALESIALIRELIEVLDVESGDIVIGTYFEKGDI